MMRNLVYTTLIALVLIGCDSSDDVSINAPTDVTSINAEPRVGGALIKWQIPTDGDYTYVQISYLKNGKQVIEKASKYTDTLLVEGLINKEEFSFDIKAINETPDAIAEGKSLTSNLVRPIERSPDITYYPDNLEEITVTDDMIDTYTQETSEGPKSNLLDKDPSTYWHSAWSSGVAPLPHWIEINFAEPTDMGAIKYWFRNNSDTRGRPTQWGLATSEDGETWERVWESKENLSIADNTVEHSVAFDKNYKATNFRVLILQNPTGSSFAHLGEISFYDMESKIVDKEQEAEEIYYAF